MPKFLAEVIALIIGWWVCISLLFGGFIFGYWISPHVWDGSRDTFGLLSAITVLWIYEHRNMEEKYERLHNLVIQSLEGRR